MDYTRHPIGQKPWAAPTDSQNARTPYPSTNPVLHGRTEKPQPPRIDAPIAVRQAMTNVPPHPSEGSNAPHSAPPAPTAESPITGQSSLEAQKPNRTTPYRTRRTPSRPSLPPTYWPTTSTTQHRTNGTKAHPRNSHTSPSPSNYNQATTLDSEGRHPSAPYPRQ